jgi:hypothetical protein
MKLTMKMILLIAVCGALTVATQAPVPGTSSSSMSSVAEAYMITVKNSCGYDIYVRGADQTKPLTPDNKVLSKNGGTQQYQINLPWISGRIYGCWDNMGGLNIINGANADTMLKHCAWIEPTIKDLGPTMMGNLFSNMTYADAMSIPMRIESPGGRYCTNSGSVTTRFSSDQVIKGCPTTLVNGKVCLSSNEYCRVYCPVNPQDTKCQTYCSKLDKVIQACKQEYADCKAGSATTKDVYGCQGFFIGGVGEKYCMAINRGILSSANNQTNPKTFYPKGGTYNDYGAYVHAIAGPVFALSYDDYPSSLNQGGYLNCQSSTRYNIEFCPQPATNIFSYLHGPKGSSSDSSEDPEGTVGFDWDEYRFYGKRDEEITLRLEAVGKKEGHGALSLSGRDLQEDVGGPLPLEIQVTLPHKAKYHIWVTNLKPAGGPPFIGHYRLSLKSSKSAWKSLNPQRLVEQ